MSSAKHSLCAKCSMPIVNDSLYVAGRLYHHECSPYTCDPSQALAHAAAAVTFWIEPTCNLRWNGGVLEQLFRRHEDSGAEKEIKMVWAPIPAVTAALSPKQAKDIE